MSGVWLRGFVSAETAAELVAALDGASTFVDGRATAHGAARAAKDNQQLPPDDPLTRQLGARLAAAANTNERFRALAMPRTLLPFAFSRYDVGMTYGDHLDLPVMGSSLGPIRTDLAMTVFLVPRTSYDGGELTLHEGETLRRLKGDAGDAYLYPASTIHRVEPVTRGRRLVAFTWLQSLVADTEARELLASLTLSLAELQAAGAPEDALLRLRAVHHRLTRRWVR